jgi:hypothetical protein
LNRSISFAAASVASSKVFLSMCKDSFPVRRMKKDLGLVFSRQLVLSSLFM